MSEPSRRRGLGHRMGWVWVAILAGIMVVAFAVVTSLYDAEGSVTQSGGTTESVTSGFGAKVTPIAVTPLMSTATVRLAFHAYGEELLDGNGRLGQNTRITVVTDRGVVENRYFAGTVPSPVEAEVGIDGDQALYPFDEHAGYLIVVVDSFAVQDDGSIVSLEELPLTLVSGGGVSGWNTAVTMSAPMSEEPQAAFVFNRAFSTQAFAMLILIMSVVLAALALTVGVLVRTGRRIAEGALLGWSAALIFALPALRNFMPNSPPIGVAIDIYVFLWVMVGAVCAAVLVILGWIEKGRVRKDVEHAA